MKHIRNIVVFSAVAGMFCQGLSAKDYVWTGAQSACWTNAANWVDSSGAAVDKCPGIAATGDETADWAALRAESDTAFFSQPSSRTQIDLDGLFAVSKIVFSASTAPGYVLGTGEEQRLPIRQRGSVTIESSVENMPVIAVPIIYPKGATDKWATLTFSNKAGGVLELAGFADVVKDPSISSLTLSAQLTFAGKGGYRIFGSKISNLDFYVTTSGKINIAGDIKGVRRLYFSGAGGMEIEDGCNFYSSSNLDHMIDLSGCTADDTVEISGAGKFHLLSKSNNKQLFDPVNGHLVFTCPVVVDSNTWGGMIIQGKTGGGSVEFKNTLSGLSGPVEVNAPVSFRASSIGADQSVSQAGTGSLVLLKNGGALEYTGNGETTERNLEIGGGIGALINSGTGAWTVASPLSVSAASTLKLGGDSSAAALLTSPVNAAGELSFVKAGAGKWTLAGDIAVDGDASVEGGRLILTDKTCGTFAAADGLRMQGGGVLEFTASVSSASLPELTAGARGGKIVVPDGCTVTLSAPPVDDGGTIDVDLQGSGRIFCPAAAGRLFPFFTVGGLTGVFKADGELFGDKYPEIETLIAARGGVVPDGASAKVAIALPGEESLGPVTLARSACAAELLVQKADVPATVALGGGTFSIGTLSMLSRTGGLTIGAAAGDGILQAGGVLTLENYSRDTALTVNSTLTAADGGSRLVKTGCGDAAVAELEGTWSAEPSEGRLTLSGKGDFDLTAAVSGGARLALKDIADDAGASTPDAVAGFLVGRGGDGILEIGSGTAMTNRLYVGYGGVGAVYQTGGYFFNRFAGGDVLLRPGIGYDGYGYYELRGGVYAEGGGIRQMCATQNSVGVLDIYGGEMKAAGTDQLWMNAKAGAVGVVVMRGGSYEVKGIARVPDNKGVFCFTQEGEDSVASFNTLEMGCVSDSTSIVNLNGGVFSAAEICRWNVSGTVSVFNFNGGTMKARNDKPLFRAYSSRVMIDHVVSYGRGAAFDTNGNNVELGMPVEAPSGLGVASIVWTAADAAENRYVGAPAVVISGDGFGATACADFDFRSGCVTNIRVTCSGSGYTQGSVSATLRYGSERRQLQVTLSPVVPGGIVKKGRGTLTLDKANSYVGETAVEAGTLKSGTAGAIPSGGVLRLDGGVLDLNGHTPTFSGICGSGGKVVNGAVTLAGEWKIDAASRTAKTELDGELAFAADASIRITSADSLDPAIRTRYVLVRTVNGHSVSGTPKIVGGLPKGWTVGVSSAQVVLRYLRGMTMIVR